MLASNTNEISDRRIAVVGAGANGASIAADLTLAGLNVTCIEQWPEHVEAIRSEGVRIDAPDGVRTTELKIFHVCEVAALRETFDLVLIVVKAYDTRWACELIKPLVAPDGLVVGVQNGMTLDDMASIVGPERTLGAVIEIAANMFDPGTVERQTGRSGTWFNIGAFDSSTRGREEEVTAVLRHVGVVEVTEDIRSAKWMKLVANAAEMLPSAILDMPLVEALHVPGMREVMDAAGKEALDAALMLGHRIVPMFGQEGIEDLPPERYSGALLDAVVAGWSLESTRVAILQDWMKGRRAEGEEINGLVVKELKRFGHTSSVNERLVELSGQIEAGLLTPGPSNADLLTSFAGVRAE
jgi:2-dehydropantoate 2-reductase